MTMYRLIPGLPTYRAGDDGTIWSSTPARGTKVRPWKKMKPIKTSKWGHLSVNLRAGVRRLIHRLILETFVGPCPGGMECCHNDGDPTNNALSNLRWDTSKANKADMAKHGRVSGWRARNPQDRHRRVKTAGEAAAKAEEGGGGEEAE